MVLGHEGVGIVEAVGPACRLLKKGDRVGWGYETDSCGHCIECLSGYETTCAERSDYGSKNLDQGSFASHAIWRESFLHQIPEGLSDVDAAPLQCAGATIFTALQGIQTGDSVGILGVGGLGHLAIQFAAKLGCRVVVLSGTESKRAEALKLGAHEYIVTRGVTELSLSVPLNRLLVTAAVPPNWALIAPIMAPRSVIYPLTVNDGNMEIPYMTLIGKEMAVQGSGTGSRRLHRNMLEFAALQGIRPITQQFPMTEEGITEAMDKLARNEVHYRAVLVPSSV
jgi:D-arabinose 1-dehydrogenase-like Zn-dependent alcohol dehydrogenase